MSKSSTLDDILNHFNITCGTMLRMSSKKQSQLVNRLKTFTPEEIKQAIERRVTSPFHAGENPEARLWFKDWDSLLRNDAKIESLLTREEKPAETQDEYAERVTGLKIK